MDKHELQSLIKKSCDVILKYQEPSGAYPACPYYKAYKYSWLRDGAFTADAMSRAGQIESAESFFDWCSRIIVKRREHILSGGKLDARYTYDGRESTDEWGTFQLDGYGTWLWAMKNHEARHGRPIGQFQEAAGLIQHYLVSHWQEPCFDWWEERMGRHAASLACIYAGLKAYEHPEAETVRREIDLKKERTDGSLLACALLGAVDSQDFTPTLERIEAELISSGGGLYRYLEDEYYGGGEWLVLTSMLSWYYNKLGSIDDAAVKLEWVKSRIDENGWMPEQTADNLLHPERYEPWVEQAGNPANPLLWSHAMFITAATELLYGRG